jgi:hypothetical protein
MAVHTAGLPVTPWVTNEGYFTHCEDYHRSQYALGSGIMRAPSGGANTTGDAQFLLTLYPGIYGECRLGLPEFRHI